MAFWTSILAWGRRQTIINKAEELVRLMGGDPYQFILTHQPKDRQAFEQFKHRTFLPTDTIYFLEWLQQYYRENESLETAFAKFISPEDVTIEKGLVGFRKLFFSLPESPKRTRKHIASPQKNSTCKRLNMFLRWMVRNDDAGVDFGLWKQITPSQLCIPFDVHVERVARSLGLVTRKQRDWKTVLELTQKLREFDPNDPVKYDFALFGLGVLEQAGPPLK
jgi:uncharacterized protein (TIGR02757 family)